jgi:hypothetical protein
MFRLGPRTEISAVFLLAPALLPAAAFTTKLQKQTILAWDRYIAHFEHSDLESEPLQPGGEEPVLTDLNPDGRGIDGEVPGGYIHHWRGVVRLSATRLDRIVAVLEDYADWREIYSPDVKLASAIPTAVEGGRGYDLRLVSEQIDGLLHFAFDAHFHVRFRRLGDWTLIDSRSYDIRESNSGHAPFTDLLPEGNDHGIAWRINTYWRLREIDGAAYAECQVITLSRKPLFGTTGHIKGRARESLRATMVHTRNRAMALEQR